MSLIPEVTVVELHHRVAQGENPFLLDVRTFEEFETAHLAFTSRLIPHDLILGRLDELPADKTTPVFAFCRSGRRSAYVVELLRAAGYRNSFNVAGGILAWIAAGYEVVSL